MGVADYPAYPVSMRYAPLPEVTDCAMSQSREPKRTLKNIVFGKASAEREGAEYPDLLTKGYLNPFDVIREARDGAKFLFLGYKGSGKSALASISG